MNLKRLYRACKFLLGAAMLLAAMMAGIIGWLLYAPRDISQFNNALIDALNPDDSGLEIQIEKTLLSWDSWLDPAVIQVHHLAVRSKDQGAFITFEDVRVRLNLWRTFVGKMTPKKLEIISPQLTIAKTKDGDWLWVGQNAQSVSLKALLAPNADAKTESAFKVPFKHLEIRNATIQIYFEAQDRSLTLASANLNWQMNDDAEHALTTHAELNINDHTIATHASLAITPDAAPYAKARLWLKSANPYWLCDGWVDCADVPSINMPIDIDILANLNRRFEPIRMEYDLKGELGKIAFKPHLPETLMLDHFTANGAVDMENKQLSLTELLLKFGKTEISGTGDIAQKPEGVAVNFDGAAKMMPVNDLGKYWPATLAPASREWAITSIRGGMAELGTASLRIAAGDLDKEVFPDEALKSYVKVKNTTVEYLKGFPKATNASGEVMFTGTTMKADIVSAKAMTGSEIDQAHLFFTDLNHPNTPVEAELSLKSPAADVVKFLQPPYLDVLGKIPADFSATSGDTQGNIKLKFDAFGEHSKDGTINWDKVEYDVDAKLVNINNIMLDEGMVVQGANGTFKGNNRSLHFKGEGLMNGQTLAFGYQEEGTDTGVYSIKGVLSEAILARAGLAKSEEIQGAIGVDAVIEHSPAGYTISGEADLSKTQITIADIGYQKPAGQASSLSIKPDEGGYSAIKFLTADASAAGKIKIHPTSHQLEAVRLNALKIGNTNLSEVFYVQQPNGKQLTVKGALLDLSGMPEDDKNEQSISQFPAIDLALDIGEIRLPKEQGLRNLKADVMCSAARCESADVSANFLDKGSLEMRIYHEAGKRKFAMHSDNAGNLARTVDAVDEMIGGTLEISGDYDDSKSGNPLSGRFTITDYVLKDAPLLGKILNLSSLTGALQTLSGQGMKFEKLATDFTFVNDVFTMKNGKATGPSLGIVMKGKVDIAGSTLDMDGNLAPIQIINSFIGKIPLVGQMLAGGEGESIFAFNFSIQGSHDDPNVSVNPLSVLTPGFTRKFFDIFDAPATAEPAKPAPEKMVKPEAQDIKEPSAPVPLMAP